jgi:outer membrane protein assembly factor BamB
VWPGIVVVVLQWLAVAGTGWVAPATPLQFFGMLVGPLVGTLLMLLWWLLASRAAWSERLTITALTIAAAVVTFVLAHETAKMAVFVFGIPAIWTAFVGAAALARRWSSGARRRAMAAAVLLVCVGWLVVRSEGVDGNMSGNYAWRWSATAEQQFLASASQIGAGTAPSGGEAAMPAVAEWPGFRGASRDSVIRGLRLETDWQASPPDELWRRPVGPGWSSFAIAGDRLYTQEQRGEDEVVTCYRASTGEPLWLHADRARFWEALAGAGPRATPTYHEGRIYTFGATGILNCLDADTGEVLWSRDSAADTAAPTPDWGFASSPLVIDGLVVVHTGAPDAKAVAAYDADSGEPRWYAPAGALSYSSAQLGTIEGVRHLVVLTGDGATGLAPLSGEVLWKHEWPLDGGARILQPALLDDGSVLIGTAFGMGLRRVFVSRAAEAWVVDEGWTSTGLKPYYDDLVVHRDHVYGFDGRILACLDLATGERAWKGGRYGNGQLLLLAGQDLLLVLSDRGEVALVEAVPSAFTEVTRFGAIEGKTWNHPVIADGVLYVRNSEEMAAFRLPTR